MGAKDGNSTDGGASTPATATTRTATKRPYDSFRENVEALVVAVILALIIRHFSVEAFEIPTGSMAPTLYGIHAWLECPNCSTEFNVALRSSGGALSVPYRPLRVYEGPSPEPDSPSLLHVVEGRLARDSLHRNTASGFDVPADAVRQTEGVAAWARCPLCEFEYRAVIEKKNRTGGHKILVTKFAYQVSEPERWDVIVFTFDQHKNYIKRLIGRPNERIDIWDGDIYVDGQVQRKPGHAYIQDVQWRKVYDSDIKERGLRGHPPAWRELGPAGSGREAAPAKTLDWDAVAGRFSINAGGDLAVLDYTRKFDNYTSYNLLAAGIGGSPARSWVGDKKVAFTVKPVRGGAAGGDEQSWVGAELRDRDFTFQLRIPVVPSSKAVEGQVTVIERMVTQESGPPRPGRPADPSSLRVEAPFAIVSDEDARIEFENVDDRVTLRVNGETLLALDYQSLPEGATLPLASPPSPRSKHYLRLIFANTDVMMHSVQVFRDIYYISTPFYSGVTLGDGEYLALGDNSASSSDGRMWGSLPEKSLMGKAFAVIWPAWPTNFQMQRIR